MNIVVVSPFLLGDSTASGGNVGALGLLKSLTDRHKLYVIVLDERENPEESDQAIADMNHWAAHVRVVTQPMTIARRLRAKIGQFFFYPNGVVRTESPQFHTACRETLANFPIDMALILFPQMAQYVEEFMSVPRVMDVEDAYSVSSFRDYAAATDAGLLTRFKTFRTWISWVNFERRYYKKFNHLFAVSEQDSYGLQIFSPGLRLTVLPRMLTLDSETCVSEEAQFDIGFIGSFIHKPNLLALDFLFEEILPLVLKRLPGFRVLIAGKNPPQDLVDRAPSCVTFAGFVPQVEDFYRQIRSIVAPLLTGGGIKIKVVEGLLSGLPVVMTSIAAEGIDAKDGTDAFIADSAEAFAAAVIKLAVEPELRVAMGERGRIHALAMGSEQEHATIVDRVFESMRGPA